MEEQELRHALRGAMAATAQPPSMNEVEMLDVAKRANRRRRATLAGVACAAAVMVIAAGTMIVAAVSGGDTPSGDVGAPGVTETTPPTETTWPDGQTDRTAQQGPRYDKGVQLLDLLTTSLPAGLESPADLKPADPSLRHGDLRNHQAQFADEINGKQIWEYLAELPVGANGKWGRLLVEVHIAGNAVKGAGCGLTMTFWGMGGKCELVDVGGTQVGVVTETTGDDRFDQWAAYRHTDGTVVYIAQARSYNMTGLPGLAEPPLTVQQLAGLAVDPKFRLE